MKILPDLSQLSHADKDILIAELFSFVQSLQSTIKTLENDIRTLKDQLAKTSHNSGKPPSSDGYEKPKPKSLRNKTGRNSGGQPGHDGCTLAQTTTPDFIETHAVNICEHCGCDLTASPVVAHTCRQVFESPEIALQVTEHRAEVKICPDCSQKNQAKFPVGITQPVQYGARVQALATYFSQYQLLPYQRVQELFRDIFNAQISQGTLANILTRAHASLEQHQENVKQHLSASAVAHFDETGMRVNGKLYWLHIASTAEVTHYEIHEKRGGEAIDSIGILPNFKGIAVHDHWRSYLIYDCPHALCNAHHLRELIFAEEEYQQFWAKKLSRCLTDALKEVDAAKKNGLSKLPGHRVAYFSRRYSRILREGAAELSKLGPEPNPDTQPKRGRVKQHKVTNLRERLKAYKTETLRFIADFSVPFDNNQAERDARMSKVKQKISGCFRSLRGAEIFCRIRGYLSSARKQGENSLERLSALIRGEPILVIWAE